MGEIISRIKETSAIQQRAKQQEDSLKAAIKQQEETSRVLEGTKDALTRTTEALKRAEAMAQEQDELMRRVNEARREAEEARKFADERANELREMVQRLAEEAKTAREDEREMRRAKEEAEKVANAAREAKEEAEKQLREGIQPIIIPTQAQYEATKRSLSYRSDFFHFAVAGVSGSGKSSLINAFRGLRNKDRGAAPTGVAETTTHVARYADPNTDMPYVWYDVPGAGTLTIPDWQYFTDQGLYIFNCIIIAIDSRFTTTDIAILRNCVRFQIPTFIVRSKSDQHIQNIAKDMGSDDDDGDDREDEEAEGQRKARAREHYIRDTHASVARNLAKAGLLAQRVYLIDKEVLAKVVRGRKVRECIDELDLIRDMFALANAGEAEANR